MALFSYTAIGANGMEESDVLEAASLQAAAEELRSRRIMVTSLHEVESQAEKGATSIVLFLSRISATDRILFFREFAALVRAGLTVVEALSILERQSTTGKLRYLLASMRRDVEQGASLAAAMGRYSRTFGTVVVSMIEAGEVGGMLDSVLERIADMLESQAEFRTQVVSTLSYPIIVSVVMVAVLLTLAVWIVPQIEPYITAQTGGAMPWNTKVLFRVSRWLAGHLPYVGIAVAGVAAGMVVFYNTSRGRWLLDRIRLQLPVVGSVFLASSMVHFSRNLGSLLASGVPLLVAIETTRNTIGNEAVARVADQLHDRVIRGDSLSGPLKDSPIMPPMVSGMVAVGEETGSLDRSLQMVGDIYEKLLATRVQRMNMLMEPTLLFILVGLVALVGWCLLSGILSLYKV